MCGGTVEEGTTFPNASLGRVSEHINCFIPRKLVQHLGGKYGLITTPRASNKIGIRMTFSFPSIRQRYLVLRFQFVWTVAGTQ